MPGDVTSRLLKNVYGVALGRQNQAKKRSLCVINEHFELDFNASRTSKLVFQQAALDSLDLFFTTALTAKHRHQLALLDVEALGGNYLPLVKTTATEGLTLVLLGRRLALERQNISHDRSGTQTTQG